MELDAGLAGKVAIVTGGSRGIGRAIVELLAAEGADVTFFFRDNADAARTVVATNRAAGRKVSSEQVDVRDSTACAAAVVGAAMARSVSAAPAPESFRNSRRLLSFHCMATPLVSHKIFKGVASPTQPHPQRLAHRIARERPVSDL